MFNHLSELGYLKEREDDVVTYTDYLKEMKEHVKMITEDTKLDDNLLAKSNVDHPIISALHTLKVAEDDVQCSKRRVNDMKSRIAARKAGPFGWVVDMYGERL